MSRETLDEADTSTGFNGVVFGRFGRHGVIGVTVPGIDYRKVDRERGWRAGGGPFFLKPRKSLQACRKT